MLDRLISNFELYFSSIAHEVSDYKETFDFNELMVTLNDGSKILYDDTEHTIRNLPSDSNNMSDDQIKSEFGLRMRKIMSRRGITQEELSKKTGITQAMLSRYICGESAPTFPNVDRIAKAIGCSTEELRYI